AAFQLSGAVPSVAYNEDLFWGGGHVLQIVNTIVMLSAWCLLGEVALGRPLVSRKALKAAFGLCLIAAVAAPIFYAFFTFESGDLGVAHSQLKYVLGLPALIVVFSALKNVGKISFLNQRRSPAFTALSLSVILFAIGGVMGLFADGADTRTPAHYHGVLGAVNLAFFGVVMFYILPLLGRGLKPTRWRFAPLYVYAVGQLLQSLGLFIAEAPRKTMGAAQALDSALAKIGMHMNNSGGAIAVIGGILFVWIAGRALLGRTSDSLE
ncbi:MAG: cbb3-type cytochrome c oxidase subunit I, partial [Rhodospirillales bacterium]|nr:cbb3-type cytochrome c oxidase subunit I [Rhodospirillales bacterium]